MKGNYRRSVSSIALRVALLTLSSAWITVPALAQSSSVVHITKRNAPEFALDGQEGGANSQNVHMWSADKNDVNQQWIEVDRGNGFFSYRKVGTTHCISGGSAGSSGQNVFLWRCGSDNQNQHWHKVNTDSGFVKLIKRNASGFTLDGGSGGANSQNVRLYDSGNASHNLQWNIELLSAEPENETQCEVPAIAEVVGVELQQALTSLQSHLNGESTLTDAAIGSVAASIETFAEQLTSSPTLINQAFSAIARYDDVYGSLFLNDQTRGGVPRTPTTAGDAIHYAMIVLQQSVIDHAYANQNVHRYQSTFENRAYSTADYFPGALSSDGTAPIGDDGSLEEYAVDIDGSNNPSLSHRPYGAFTDSSRRPTGAYAPAGAIVKVTVPDELVGAGYKVRVGAHSWDLSAKNTITRLDRVSMLYDIDCASTLVSNPLGGGIYIDVPFEADAGTVNVQIDNAVRSPFYAARSFTQHTSAAEWETEKGHVAPWADLESDHFMIQVPTPWLDEIEDPAQLMADWDAAMQSILDLYGVSETQKTMLYVQIDTILRGVANFPGYPMSNYPYNPAAPSAGIHRTFLRGPDEVGNVTFHELGHQLFFTKFQGESESVVHLPYVNFMNRVFGVDLDTAFSRSSFRNPNVNLDQAFMNWAVRPNFQQGLPMRSDRPNSEKAYQRRGYAHYIVIAELFGWEALERFWASEHVDYANGIDYDRNSDRSFGDTDSRILRMSRAAGVDLRPLLHMWGIQADLTINLASAIQAEALPASAKIYDELESYKSLVPMNNEEFFQHARTMYPLLQANANTEAFEGWYFEKVQTYSTADAEASQQALQNVIDLYFPAGRPASGN